MSEENYELKYYVFKNYITIKVKAIHKLNKNNKK